MHVPHLTQSSPLEHWVRTGMPVLDAEMSSGAEFFSAGRFSEALSAYDSAEGSNNDRISIGDVFGQAVPSLKAVYAACNRAAAKLELEMCRSCLRDCEEAIQMDPHCLRAYMLKGQAYHRLGKTSRAREAIEAGVAAGRESGDVVLFVELVKILNVITEEGFPETSSARATPLAQYTAIKRSADGACPTEVEKIAGECLVESITEGSDLPGSIVADGASLGRESSPEDRNTPGAASDPTASDDPDDHSVGAGEEHSGEAGDGSDGEEEGGVDTPGTPVEGESGTAGAKAKKKKKKKSRNKRNKASRNTWAGGEDEFGQKLTLKANKDGGGVVVEGLSAVLAASDISPVLLEAARGQLAHATRDPDVDNLIALGYLQVNTGNYRKAVELFRGLLSIRPGLVGAHLGLGSALALLGGMENAVTSFSAAIEADPMEPDCWKRRGQTRAAMGHAAGALGDLDRAVELFNGRDADVYHQRAMVYHKLRYFNRAVLDFQEVVKTNVDSRVDWNMIGLCRGQLGEPEVSAKAYRRALLIDPTFKEAYTNLGSLLRDWGKGDEALVAFNSALELDTAYVHAYYLRGLCKHGMGDHRSAQADFLRGLFYDGKDEHCRYMAALCMHARGQMDEAVRCYDALLSLKPGHQAWYNRECCVYLWLNLRRPWREFSPDVELDPEFKEGMCKRHDPMTLKRYKRHRKPTGSAARVSLADVRPPAAEPSSGGSDDRLTLAVSPFAKPSTVEIVLRTAQPLGPGIQLTCPGFLTNARQHRMFGLAALELAQLVRGHWNDLRSGGTGVLVPDGGSSAWRKSTTTAARAVSRGPKVGHPVGYRDVFDVAVRWRQLSEPNDPVWWIDRLTPEAFGEGFGLQTPMVNGQLKVIRYYPYYKMAISLMKELMLEQSVLSEEAKATVSKPEAGLSELHSAVGHDHWVVTPCERVSLAPGTQGRVMEGTRLTIVASPPEGYEFTIRTPGTPNRWRQYDEELNAVWRKLTSAVCERSDEANIRRPQGEGEEGEDKDDAVCDIILEIFYYWVNFGPLSRGSAACGYIVLSGLMAAAGWRLADPPPPNIQMDWEAILRPNPEAFMTIARPWLRRSRRREDILEGVPPVKDALPTALEAIKALNGP